MQTTFRLFVSSLLLFALACNRQETAIDGSCLPQQIAKRLYKTVSTAQPAGSGAHSTVYTAEFFFDQQNRVDSIRMNDTPYKVMYNAAGQVDKLLTYFAEHPAIVQSEQTYHYQMGRLDKTISQNFDLQGNPQGWRPVVYYTWNSEGFLEKTRYEGGDEETVYSHDGCGNRVETREMSLPTGLETMLVVAQFSDTFSPYFLIGLDKIFPAQYSAHNKIMEQIVHWDCADYDPDPIVFEYEYGPDGLPTTMSSRYGTVAFFYE
ncbi:MAG: hypothetical protein SFV52_13795 [Saprospiraceae bacterium]|nr:hypothetical protein [Saprospiraceae bacterium]